MKFSRDFAHRALPVPARSNGGALGGLVAAATVAVVLSGRAVAHPLDQGGNFTPIEHIAVFRDQIYIADVTAGVVRIIGRDGTLAGTIGDGVLRKPQGIAIDSNGQVFVSDSGLNQIVVFSPAGQVVRVIGSRGRRPGQFLHPRAVDISPDGRIVVADTKNHRIQLLAADGQLLMCVGRFGNRPGEFNIPEGVRFGPDGLIYVADTVNHRVQVLDAQGNVVRIVGQYGIDPGCLYFPEDVAIDGDGRLYVSDTFNQRISIFKSDGSLLALAYTFADGTPLTYPYGIALGEDDRLWVLDMPRGEVGVVPWEPASPEVIAAAQQAAQRKRTTGRQLVDLLAVNLSGRMILVALAVAVLLGAAHALEPGHGKTLVAAYLVGTRGRPWHAVILGLTVTAAHVGSVIIVGLIALAASEYVLPSRIAPWLSFASGVVIAAVGLWMFRRAGAEHGHSHAHPHSHGIFGHSHTHSHEHVDSAHEHRHGHDHPHDHFHSDGSADEHLSHRHADNGGDDHERAHAHAHPHEHHHAEDGASKAALAQHAHDGHHEHGDGHDHTGGHGHPYDHNHNSHEQVGSRGQRDGHEELGHSHADAHGSHTHDHPDAHSHTHHPATAHDHVHGHGAGAHLSDHAHSHDHGAGDRDSSAGAPGRRDLSLGALLGLGISGGIVPCPSAIVVLLTAVSVGRIGLGILLILAFSVGLAATLVAIGVAITLGAGFLADRVESSRVVAALPYISAGVVTGLGLLIALQGLRALGYI